MSDTFGLIGESTPRVFRKPVTLVEVIPAPPAKKTLTVHPTAAAALSGNDPLTEIDRSTGYLYLRAEGHAFVPEE